MKYISAILVIFILTIAACTSAPSNSLTSSNQTDSQSPSNTIYPTYTPKPTPTPRPDGEVDAEIAVYTEPWGIYGYNEWFSQEVVTTLSPGEYVKILGKLGPLFWLLVETESGEQGWVRNDFLYDPCIHIDWKGSSKSSFYEPVGGCGIEASNWMYINMDIIADIPTLPLRLSSGALSSATSEEVSNTLNVHNTTEHDAVIAIVNVDELTTPLSPDFAIGTKNFLYIRSGESASIEGIFGGPYEVYVTLGAEWHPDYGAFSEDPSYWKLLDPYDFPFVESFMCNLYGVNCDSKTYTLELSEIMGGTLKSTTITAEAFPNVNLPHPYHGDDDYAFAEDEGSVTTGGFADMTCTDPQEGTFPPYIDILGVNLELSGRELYAEIFLSGLPDALTFDRAGTDTDMVEYEWTIEIDVDYSKDTGFQGFDYQITASYYSTGGSPWEGELSTSVWATVYELDSTGGDSYVDDAIFDTFQENNSVLMYATIPGISENSRFRISAYDVNPSGDPLIDYLECEISP